MRFPSIAHVRSALFASWRSIRRMHTANELSGNTDDCEPTVDVRLQVWPDGTWQIHTGDSSYDDDHRGYWGSSSLSWYRQDLTALAKDLIEQARDMKAQCRALRGLSA